MTQSHSATPLVWRHFPAGQHGFYRAPVLIVGATEAVLIDGGFAYSDGRAVADAIKATGKRLTLIYVSQSDPDYYFSLGPIKMSRRSSPSGVRSSKRTARRRYTMW
jgi:glyoxylase-like metal-dependent hydrolase (beta-lactamase superfamily II)